MKNNRSSLLCSTVIPLALVAGLGGAAVIAVPMIVYSPARAACNPCAVKNACNPCNPCAAAACNPCNPCAGGGGAVSQKCVVPRVQAAYKANPCAAKKACNPCSPCAAAKACNPCNPCAAAKACNPCNPCAAVKACNPCAAAKACNPCNPCAAAKACNPCAAAKACNPCNPCAAAKACNPCNPCAASACNPCNPCGAGWAAELTDAEAKEVYECLTGELTAAYAKSGHQIAEAYPSWKAYSSQAYVSATHGNRYVMNYVNKAGKAYGKYEGAGELPKGTQIAKPSFTVQSDGHAAIGPLFLMEKMDKGFNTDSGDWRYTMIMPSGQVVGETGGDGAANVEFCIGCHISVAPDQDSVMLLPDEYRVK